MYETDNWNSIEGVGVLEGRLVRARLYSLVKCEGSETDEDGVMQNGFETNRGPDGMRLELGPDSIGAANV
jgi:hypothetical protein